MDVVMFHSGNQFPVFLDDCFKQFRRFNPTTTIYFLTDSEHLGNPVFSKYEIDVRNKNDYHSSDISLFETLYGRNKDSFWTVTTTRLFFVANFLKAEGLKNICLFENDVLVYEDIRKFFTTFHHLYKNLAITVGGPDKCMTGFMFIKRPQALLHMINFFMLLLKNYKIYEIQEQYKMDMVNEMTLMRAYSKEYPERMSFLPILPFGEFSKNFTEFNSIFDPASWGQFVGGVVGQGVPGIKPEDHYIGQLLRKNPKYTVMWWVDAEGRRIPYFLYDNDTTVKINNLHIHSKNLSKYLS